MAESGPEIMQQDTKYKDIQGVSDWFIIKKQNLEGAPSLSGSQLAKKSVYHGLPLNTHIWRPPRIDQERYQCDKLAILSTVQIDLSVPKPSTPTKNKKRVRRSNSYDQLNESISQTQNNIKKSYFDEDKGDQIAQNPQKEESKDTSLDKKVEEMKMVYDLNRLGPDLDQSEKLKDYLELVDFLMRETLSSSTGLWLKGSLNGYQERALQLLHQYEYNYDLAKFHILYPGVMSIPERRDEIMHSLTEKELESIVADAVIDLRGCKTQEAEEAIANIRNAVKNRISVEDLNYYQQVLKKLRVQTPDDVETEIGNSREFSKLIKKKCGSQATGATSQVPIEKKMKMSELLQMYQESLESYYVITPEMVTLAEYVGKAKAWQERAEQLMTQQVNLKTLQTLISEARTLPVNFEELYEQARKRSNEGQQLVEKIYNNFTKVTKTRTQISSSQQVIEQSQPKKSQNSKQEEKSSNKEAQYRDLLKEADILMITHQEVNKLREHMEQVNQWKSRVLLFLEDHREQKEHKEIFSQLLKETALFKFELDLSEDLQQRLEFLEWHEKLQQLDISNQQQDKDQLIRLTSLQSLLDEGEQKGFTLVPLPEIERMKALRLISDQYQIEIRQALDFIEDGGKDKKQNFNHLLRLREEVGKLHIQMAEIGHLDQTIEESRVFVERCDRFLNEQFNQDEEMVEGQEALNKDEKVKFLQDMLQFKQELAKLGVMHSTFSKYNLMLRPILIWIQNTRGIIKTYYKSLELPLAFTHLNLLDHQDYHGDDYQQNSQEEQKDFSHEQIPAKDDKLLIFLLAQAETEIKILQNTKDYEILSEMRRRIQTWQRNIDILMEEKNSIPRSEFVERLENLLSENLPVPSDIFSQLGKQLRREKWIKRLNDLKNAEKVKLKQLESLAKDSNHNDIQEDEFCKNEALLLQQQLVLCRTWTDKQSSLDGNSQKEIFDLLELGKNTLQFNLGDFVELKGFHSELIQWRETTKQLLNGQKSSKYNYEFLRKHIDLGNQLDIEDHEIDLLTQLVEVCAHWKIVARKVLSSRELAKLQMAPPINITEVGDQKKIQNIVYDGDNAFTVILKKSTDHQMLEIEDVKTPFDVAMINHFSWISTQLQKTESVKTSGLYDNQKYCICRRGDDGLLFMIECDSCKEWFHGQCIGMAEEQDLINSQKQDQSQSYICIACANVFHHYDPFKILNEDQQDSLLPFNPDQLQSFSKIRLVNFDFFRQVIFEGLSIPIFLEELIELKQIHSKIENWKIRLGKCLEIPLSQQTYPSPIEQFADEESSSDFIINTKTNQTIKSDEKLLSVQPEDSLIGDQIGMDMFKLYQESFSFPVEMAEWTECLIKQIRFRKYFNEGNKLLGQLTQQKNPLFATNNGKSQIKKFLKQQLSKYDQLKAQYPEDEILKNEDLLTLQTNLNFALSVLAQNGPLPIVLANDQDSKKYDKQLQDIWKTFINKDNELCFDISDIRQTLSFLQQPSKSIPDEKKQQVKTLSEGVIKYERWVERVTECLAKNQELKFAKKIDQKLVQAFQDMIQEAENEHGWIYSLEKEQILGIWALLMSWTERCSYMIQNAELMLNPEHIDKALISELAEQYKQIPIFSTQEEQLDQVYRVVVEYYHQIPTIKEGIEQQERAETVQGEIIQEKQVEEVQKSQQ